MDGSTDPLLLEKYDEKRSGPYNKGLLSRQNESLSYHSERIPHHHFAARDWVRSCQTLPFNKYGPVPIGSMGLVYSPTLMVDFYGKCW